MVRYILLMLIIFSPSIQASNLIIELPNGEQQRLSFEDLSSLPSSSITTPLPWFTDEVTFTGVSIENLMLSHNKNEIPDRVNFRALNDYAVDISGKDIAKYHPILAYLKDGKKMKIRDKGPYWLIYPLKTYPEIDKSHYHAQMIWQVKTIKIITDD